MFRRAVKFRIGNVGNVKNSPYFLKPVIIVIILVDVIVIVSEMQIT